MHKFKDKNMNKREKSAENFGQIFLTPKIIWRNVGISIYDSASFCLFSCFQKVRYLTPGPLF
jgi:hypothetical protein